MQNGESMNSMKEREDDKPLLISVVQVAKLVGVSTRTIWRLVSEGKFLAPIRIGGRTLWIREEVIRWVSQRCPPPNPPER